MVRGAPAVGAAGGRRRLVAEAPRRQGDRLAHHRGRSRSRGRSSSRRSSGRRRRRSADRCRHPLGVFGPTRGGMHRRDVADPAPRGVQRGHDRGSLDGVEHGRTRHQQPRQVVRRGGQHVAAATHDLGGADEAEDRRDEGGVEDTGGQLDGAASGGFGACDSALAASSVLPDLSLLDGDGAGPGLGIDHEDSRRSDHDVVDVGVAPARPVDVVQHGPLVARQLGQRFFGGHGLGLGARVEVLARRRGRPTLPPALRGSPR